MQRTLARLVLPSLATLLETAGRPSSKIASLTTGKFMARSAGTKRGKGATKYSVVIPVFNSERIVADTVARTRAFFESRKLRFELILVNDGSADASWRVISGLARADKRIKAINLL